MWLDEKGFLAFASPFYEGLFVSMCLSVFSCMAAWACRDKYVYDTFIKYKFCDKQRMTINATILEKLALFYLWKYAKNKESKKSLVIYWIFWIVHFVMCSMFFLIAYDIIDGDFARKVYLIYGIVGLFTITRGNTKDRSL